MAIQLQDDLSDLSLEQLYRVYLAIAEADHRWRLRAFHGDHAPPAGQCLLRPLQLEQFRDRLDTSRAVTGGESSFRQRLSRQAAAYGVRLNSEDSRRGIVNGSATISRQSAA